MIMTVEQLIKKLEAFDPNEKVILYTESDEITCYEINDISTANAELKRSSSGKAGVLFEKSPTSQKMTFIQITSDI